MDRSRVANRVQTDSGLKRAPQSSVLRSVPLGHWGRPCDLRHFGLQRAVQKIDPRGPAALSALVGEPYGRDPIARTFHRLLRELPVLATDLPRGAARLPHFAATPHRQFDLHQNDVSPRRYSRLELAGRDGSDWPPSAVHVLAAELNGATASASK